MDDKGTLAILALLLGGSLFLLLGRKPAFAFGKEKTSLQLSPNFNLLEFLRSTLMSKLAYYQPTQDEIRNTKLLVNNILQPMRNEFGPITITGGGRVKGMKNEKGQTHYEALLAAGHMPSKTSDHYGFGAADIKGASPAITRKIFEAMKKLPSTRQIILHEYTNPDGSIKSAYIHVGVVTPTRPKITGKNYAYVTVDNKRRINVA